MRREKRERGAGNGWPRIALKLAVIFAALAWVGSCAQLAYPQGIVRAALPAAAPLPLGTYYSPDTNLEALDVAAVTSAAKTISLAAFSLSDQALIDALADRARHGVVVMIYLDRGELQAQCRGDATCARSPLHELINLNSVEIRVKRSKVLMHLKSYAVDGALERDGSANFSEQGEERQDNSAVFTGDPGTVSGFSRKFQAMWTRPDNLTVAQAITTP
jgi:phosphatidylserine/phosphatidylglycerophosphate/cardiolipin synthase-like enzyme